MQNTVLNMNMNVNVNVQDRLGDTQQGMLAELQQDDPQLAQALQSALQTGGAAMPNGVLNMMVERIYNLKDPAARRQLIESMGR